MVLEDLVVPIDAPRLNGLDVIFFIFNQIDFDTPFLTHFISRTSTFKDTNEARVFFHDGRPGRRRQHHVSITDSYLRRPGERNLM